LAKRTLDRGKDAFVNRIAAVGCAKISIVANNRISRLAIIERITGFINCAGVPIVTGSIIRYICTGINSLVTDILGAVYAVITDDWCTGQTVACGDFACLYTIAEYGIVAFCVTCAPGGLAYAVKRITFFTGGTHHRIINTTAVGWGAIGVADVGCAINTICAGAIIRFIYTYIVILITGIHGTETAVIAGVRYTRLAIIVRITEFPNGAEFTVIAHSIIRLVYAGIVDLIAGIHGAVNTVITDRRRSVDAGAVHAGLRTGAEFSIVAVRIIHAPTAVGVRFVVDKVTVIVKAAAISCTIFTRRWIT
jgi:hypothetical protein